MDAYAMETTPKKSIVPHGTRLPPPRPGTRYLSVAWVGIVVADDRLRRRVDRFFHCLKTELVGGPVNVSAFAAAAGQPDRKAPMVVVATVHLSRVGARLR